MSENQVKNMLATFEEKVKNDDGSSSEIERTQGPAIEDTDKKVDLPRGQQEDIEFCRNCEGVVKKKQTRCTNCGTQTRYTGPGYRS
jgi:hypothetical protein